MGFNQYQERLKELLIKGVIGFGIGLFVFFALMGEDVSELGMGLVFALIYSGLPYGWELSGRVIGFSVIGSIPVMVVFFIFRLAAALFVGVFGYPVVLIYNLVKMLQEKKCEG